MGRGSPICEECVKRWWNTLKTTFLNVKLQRLCKSHHLQCITSSKDSEKLEKSLCVMGHLPACYQRSVQNPASLMVWGCINAYSMGSLHVLEGTMNAERYIKVLEQHLLPSRWRVFQRRPCVFQQDNAKPHSAAITTSWLRSRRVRGAELACLHSRSFTYREHFAASLNEKYIKMTTNSSAAGSLYQARMDQIPTPKLQKLITSMPRHLQTVLKRRGDATPW